MTGSMGLPAPHGVGEAAAGACTARSKRTGARCRKHAAPGRDVCSMHGGKTPRGIHSPHWRGRGYSKDLPTRLADRFRLALQDPQLLELSSEIALLDARVGELLAGLPKDRAAADHDTWGELVALVEQRRKCVDTERRREELLGLHLTAAQALAFVAALQTAVVDVITDREQRRQIAERVQRLLSLQTNALPAGEASGG